MVHSSILRDNNIYKEEAMRQRSRSSFEVFHSILSNTNDLNENHNRKNDYTDLHINKNNIFTFHINDIIIKIKSNYYFKKSYKICTYVLTKKCIMVLLTLLFFLTLLFHYYIYNYTIHHKINNKHMILHTNTNNNELNNINYDQPVNVGIKKIPIIYIVNLPHREDRLIKIKNNFKKNAPFTYSSTNVHRAIAIIGKKINLNKLYIENKIHDKAYRSLLSPRKIGGMYMTPGGLGCFLSHINIWKIAIEKNQSIIVFEDDIEIIPEFDTIFNAILLELPENYGIFYFADCVQSYNSKNAEKPYYTYSLYNNTKYLSNLLVQLNGEHWGTYAYMISPNAAKILYNSVFPIKYQVDSFIIETCNKNNIQVFRSKQNLVFTDNSPTRDSDVQIKDQIINSNKNPIENIHISIPPVIITLEHIEPFNHINLDQYPILKENKLYNKIMSMFSIQNNNNNNEKTTTIRQIIENKKIQKEFQLKTTFKIDHWDRSRIIQEELDKDLNEIILLEKNNNYDFKVRLLILRIQLKILHDYGGIFLSNEYHLRHSLDNLLLDLTGFISYHIEQNKMITFPLIGMQPGNPLALELITKIDTILLSLSAPPPGHSNIKILDNYYTILWNDILSFMNSKCVFLPQPNKVLLFQSSVFENTGF